MIAQIVSEKTTETVPTFLTWAARENGTLHLVRETLIQCPGCGDYCGYLYHDADTPEGACLECKIDHDLVAAREALEDERIWAETACCCGID